MVGEGNAAYLKIATIPVMSRTWRVSALGRVGVLALIPLSMAVAWLLWDSVPVSLLAGVGALAAWWRFSLHPAVILTGTELIVRNPYGQRRVALTDVVDAAPGYGGLTVTTSTGEHVVAWAVQKSNLATWTARRTRADEVAEAIVAACGRHREPV